MKSVFGYFLYIKSNWRIEDSCLARSRLTAIPCFASWTLSNRKSTPALAHSRNSFKMYFVHWELLINSYLCKIKNRITDVIRFFMVDLNVQNHTADFAKPCVVWLWVHFHTCIFSRVNFSKNFCKKCTPSNPLIAWKLKKVQNC